MKLSEYLTVDNIDLECSAQSIKQVFSCIAGHAMSNPILGAAGVDEQVIISNLLERERLGSTAMGGGIALPHAKLPGLSAIQIHFVRLDKGLTDFSTPDDVPVDLVCCLLVPEDGCADQQKCVTKLARTLKNPELLQQLRTAPTQYSVLLCLDQTVTPPVKVAA